MIFLADAETKRITDLPAGWFQDRGIRHLMLDFDNTILPYTTNEADPVFDSWLEDLRSAGMTVSVVSNTRKNRVPAFCAARDLPCIIRARKPLPRGLRAMMEQLHTAPEESAMAGDQTFTDVMAGNFAGVTSILVYPLRFSNPLFRVRYWLELPFILAGRLKRGRQNRM